MARESPASTSGDFVALFELQYPRLVRALEIAGLTRAAAEDVAQESFARTLGRWRRVRGGSNPAGYVFRTAFRLARRHPDRERPLAHVSGRDSDDIAVMTSLRSSVDAVIATMPPARRKCAVLCLLAELSPREAGRALGIAESTVRKQLERARSDLKSALTSDAAPKINP